VKRGYAGRVLHKADHQEFVALEALHLDPCVAALRPVWRVRTHEGLQRKTDALHAYAKYYEYAPKRSDLRATREFAASQVGIPFQEADDTDVGAAHPLVTFSVTIGGERVLVQAQNDSGRSLEELVKTAEELVQSSNPFEAWVHLHKHAELLTAIGDAILSSMAQAQPDVRARAGAEWYREALRQVREGHAVAPFAKLVHVSEADFLAFVTAVDDLQPLLMKLTEATTDAERDAILDEHPELQTDDRVLTFLRILGGLQRDPAARNVIQSVFTLVHRARRGHHRAERRRMPTGVEQAFDRATAAVEHGSVEEISAALAEWGSIGVQEVVDPSLFALSQGVLLLARYERAGDVADLRTACTTLRNAVKSDTDPDSPILPYHYATAVLRRFEREGNVVDLDQAIAVVRQVLTLVVDGTTLEGAARSLWDRY
jgi:hypothetical protein